MTTLDIAPAQPEDAALIMRFINDLALFEKLEKDVMATVADIEASLFSADATAKALICRRDGKAIGYAVYFFNYSTWLGRKGLFLEDLYIAPDQRGQGAGRAALNYLAQLAVKENCGRFEWCVLDWNEPAIKFYESIGAKPLSEWVMYRLDGEALDKFAAAES